MNNGARRPPAVTGSITNDNSGMPTMENPPPNAPFMKQIRNTPAKAINTVGTVSSGAIILSPPIGNGHDAVDRCLDLATRDTDVLQCAVIELAKVCNGGTANEMARDPLPKGVENPKAGA